MPRCPRDFDTSVLGSTPASSLGSYVLALHSRANVTVLDEYGRSLSFLLVKYVNSLDICARNDNL